MIYSLGRVIIEVNDLDSYLKPWFKILSYINWHRRKFSFHLSTGTARMPTHSRCALCKASRSNRRAHVRPCSHRRPRATSREALQPPKVASDLARGPTTKESLTCGHGAPRVRLRIFLILKPLFLNFSSFVFFYSFIIIFYFFFPLILPFSLFIIFFCYFYDFFLILSLSPFSFIISFFLFPLILSLSLFINFFC